MTNDFTQNPTSGHTTHPSWCHRSLCIDTGQDTEHSSKAASLETSGDQLIEGALIRRDGQQSHDEPGEVSLRVDLTNMRLTGCDVQFTVAVEDLPRVARWLMTEYERALFCSYPQDARS